MTNTLIKLFILIAITTMAISCNLIKSKDEIDLQLSSGPPYTLHVRNFIWGYGTVELNKFHGDFDKLDQEVYNLLKGKTGSCQVYLHNSNKDKYGNVGDTTDNIGTIDIDELNKFQDWTYWQKEHGLRTLLYKKYVQKEPIATDIDTTTMSTYTEKDTSTVVTSSPIKADEPVNSNTYLFSIEQLYPTGDLPPTDEANRFVITGKIDKVRFNEGVFGVITIDGDKVAMMFNPDDMEQSELKRFSSVLVYGNKIKCVGTNAGESLYGLLAAKIIVQ